MYFAVYVQVSQKLYTEVMIEQWIRFWIKNQESMVRIPAQTYEQYIFCLLSARWRVDFETTSAAWIINKPKVVLYSGPKEKTLWVSCSPYFVQCVLIHAFLFSLHIGIPLLSQSARMLSTTTTMHGALNQTAMYGVKPTYMLTTHIENQQKLQVIVVVLVYLAAA